MMYDGAINVLYVLDLAFIPMFLLRHIVLLRHPAIIAALITCTLTLLGNYSIHL